MKLESYRMSRLRVREECFRVIVRVMPVCSSFSYRKFPFFTNHFDGFSKRQTQLMLQNCLLRWHRNRFATWPASLWPSATFTVVFFDVIALTLSLISTIFPHTIPNDRDSCIRPLNFNLETFITVRHLRNWLSLARIESQFAGETS